MSWSEYGEADRTDGLAGAEPEREAIGFSDLEPDEALLVSLFRGWRYGAPTAAIAAHMVAIRLRRLDYYQYTDLFLDVFKSIGPDHTVCPQQIEDPLLAPEEEALIGHMAALLGRPEGAAGAQPSSRQPMRRPFSVRPVEAIARSGRDRLEMMIARSYRLVYTRLPADF
ncbi:hypothetical protein ACUSIJ_10420 [Pseudochelatococcus sp. B33]